jgi:hypothetical protein
VVSVGASVGARLAGGTKKAAVATLLRKDEAGRQGPTRVS